MIHLAHEAKIFVLNILRNRIKLACLIEPICLIIFMTVAILVDVQNQQLSITGYKLWLIIAWLIIIFLVLLLAFLHKLLGFAGMERIIFPRQKILVTIFVICYSLALSIGIASSLILPSLAILVITLYLSFLLYQARL